jgi:hypothetical protein
MPREARCSKKRRPSGCMQAHSTANGSTRRYHGGGWLFVFPLNAYEALAVKSGAAAQLLPHHPAYHALSPKRSTKYIRHESAGSRKEV